MICKPVVTMMAAAAVMFALAACGSGGERIRPVTAAPGDVRSKAEQAERRGDWAGAAQYWDILVQAAPRDQNAAISLVRALRRSGACGRAAPVLARLQAEAPGNSAVLLEAGKCQLLSGGFAAAEAAFDAAAKRDGTSWEAESMLGIALDYRERPADALVHHDRAVALAPDNPVALANKGLSLALGGHLEDALTITRRAAALPAATPRVRANLALLEAVAGNGPVATAMAGQESADPETARLLQRIAAAARK